MSFLLPSSLPWPCPLVDGEGPAVVGEVGAHVARVDAVDHQVLVWAQTVEALLLDPGQRAQAELRHLVGARRPA